MSINVRKIAANVADWIFKEHDKMDPRQIQAGGDAYLFSKEGIRDEVDAITMGDLDCTQLDIVTDATYRLVHKPREQAMAEITNLMYGAEE